jgi:hypothetical protein
VTRLTFAISKIADPHRVGREGTPAPEPRLVTRGLLGFLAACAICLSSGQALADPARDGAREAAAPSDPALRASGSRVGTNGQRALAATPYRALRAETTAGERLGFWARGEGFANGRGASVYGTEAGAALQLLDRMMLTARYRMLGDGDGLDLTRLGAGVSAPLLGVALRF